MNYDAFGSVGRWMARSNERVFGTRDRRIDDSRLAALAARLLAVIVLALAAAWTAVFVVPAFGGAFVAVAVGFVAFWATPFLVVRSVVATLDATGA